MFVELHLLQNIPPANLNRDDTGMPKDCEFGGERRARVSSQSWKRAIRDHDAMKEIEGLIPAKRTKLLFHAVAERLEEKAHERKDAEKVTKAVLEATGFKLKAAKSEDDDPPGATSILYFVNDNVFDAIAAIIHDHWDDLTADKKPDDAVLNAVADAVAEETLSPDIALFGRMIAEKPSGVLGNKHLYVDASCQVAHAISTNRVAMEEDFFTAVDDIQRDVEPGAGMMGVVDFNSSCFYRYMVVDTRQLRKNLHGNAELARKTVEGFLRAAVEAIPSGKQNTFAAHTPPDLVHVVVRDGLPVSLANAFVEPVRPDHKGDLVHHSIRKLNEHAHRVGVMYGDRGTRFSGNASLREEVAVALGTRNDKLDDLISATVTAAFNEEE